MDLKKHQQFCLGALRALRDFQKFAKFVSFFAFSKNKNGEKRDVKGGWNG